MMKMTMPPYQICVFVLTAALLQTLTLAQSSGDECQNKFTTGKEDFVLDTDESVKAGASFLPSPSVSGTKECLSACCKEPECNLAFMENGAQEGSIKSCFLFNCLYKQAKVCRFVRKKGFSNHMLTTVFDSYMKQYTGPEPRDHPPRAIGGQDRVLQPHDTVILSGVESTDDHKIVQFKWVQVSGSTSAVIEKTTFDDEVKVSSLSPGVYKFKLTVTDAAGQSDSTVVTVLVLTPEQTQHHCMVPKKVGPCRGAFPRWHYNVLTKHCENFTFGGCSPNRNNYLSEKECIQACDQVTVNSTSSRKVHVSTDEQCGVSCGPEKFPCTNGCCIDKELVCDQEKQCTDGSDEEQCDNMDSKFRRLLKINEDEDKGSAVAHCIHPPVTGPCRHSTTKWYYNPYDKKCSRFNYGGCEGNSNQFDSEEECMKLCSKITGADVFENRETFEKQEQDNHSVSIAIAVALALAILILLAVLGYCLLKEKRQKQTRRHPTTANGTHQFLAEDTEKLVYNSTTKPI